MKLRKMVICIVLILAFAYMYAHIDKTNLIHDKRIDNSEYIGLGMVQEEIRQQFVCQEDKLDALVVKCQVLGDTTDSVIQMTLKDCITGENVVSAKTDVNEMKSGNFIQISFDAIEGCKGKTYQASFKTEGMVGLVVQPEAMEETQLKIGDGEYEGTLIMKTVTKRFDVETFCVLLIIVSFIICFFRFLNRLFSR